MRKFHFKKGIMPLVGLVMTLFTTAASAQMTSVVMPSAPSIAQGTRIMAKNEGDAVASTELKVTVTGGYTPSSVYVWKKNGVVIPGATAANYAINVLTPADAGTYTCTVTRANSSTDATTVTMDADSICILQVSSANITQAPAKSPLYRSGARPPYVVYTPGTVTNVAESNLGQTLGKITALDTAALGYIKAAVAPGGKATSAKWFRNGVEINASTPGFTAADFTWTVNQGPSLQLTVSNTKASTDPNGDQYYCVLSNSKGSTTTDAFNVAFISSTAVPTFSLINGSPAPADLTTVVYDTAFIGSKVDFLNVTANNAITYQWYRGAYPNGTAISGATNSKYVPASGVWSTADADTYYLKMINGSTASSPSAYSNPIQVAVVDGKGITADAPTGNNTLAEMDTLKLTAHAKGVTIYPNSYRWMRNGQVLTQTSAFLTLSLISIADTGTYTYKAFNEVDSSAISAGVRVTITREPLPLFVNLKDVYDGVTNVISSQMSLTLKGEGSENLTNWLVIDRSKPTDAGVAPKASILANRTTYYLNSSATGQPFPTGKYTLRVSNADGTMVMEKSFEIK